MSLFCCCRPRRDDHEDDESYPPLPAAIPLPVLPPPAKLSDTRLGDSLMPSNLVHTQPNHPQDAAPSLPSAGAASSTPSLIPNHESIQLGQLVVDDSDSEVEPEGTPADNKKTTGPLDAVRTRFTRNRSHNNSKRGPQASSGSSEEEMARRAELKRIMHKRIQQELKSEQEQPEPGVESAPSAKHPPAPIELPRGGPRDNLEFSMFTAPLAKPDVHEPTANKQADVSNEPNKDNDGKEDALDRRRSSCPQSFSSSSPGGLATQVVLRERNSLPDIPPSPTICPATTQLDTRNAPSLESWPFSISASQHDEVLDTDTGLSHRPISQPGNSTDGNSALGTWLMTQEVSSREQSIGKFTDATSVATARIDEGFHVSQQSTANGGSDLQALSHVYSADLAKKLLEGDYDDQSKPPCGSMRSPKPLVEDSKVLAGMGASVVSAAVADASSSIYPSLESTRLPTPRISTSDSEVKHGTTSLHGLRLSPFKWLGADGDNSLMNPDIILRGNDSNNSLAVPATGSSRRPTAGAGSSLAVSETSSFHHREAELKTIEKRFGDILSRRGPPSPKHSKFREDFDEIGPPVAITRSSFLLQKLHITVSKRSKSDSITDANMTPRLGSPAEPPRLGCEQGSQKTDTRPSKRSGMSNTEAPSPSIYLTPTQEESTTNLWQRAVQLERESREAKAKVAAAKSRVRNQASNGSVHLKIGRWKGARRSRSFESTTVSRPTAPGPGRFSTEGTANRQVQPESPSWLARKWPARITPEEEQSGKFKPNPPSDKHNLRKPNKPTGPPESWSRWPSQTRQERTAAAGNSDSMKSRDFAVIAATDDCPMAWVTNKDPAGPHIGLQLGSRSFSGKLGKAVKSGFGKLIPPRPGPIDEVGRPLRVPTTFVAGRQLEYPELEILPTEGGYKELKALEQGIDTMKKRQRPAPMMDPIMANHKASISQTIPILVRAAEHESHDCAISPAGLLDNRLNMTSPTTVKMDTRPVTPLPRVNQTLRDSMMSTNDYFATPLTSRYQPRRVRDSTMTTGTTERYATPRSRMSRSPSLRSPSSMSGMSNHTVIRRCRSATQAGVSRPNFSISNGRSVTQPEMLKSTIEFEEELERRLETEKSEIFAIARSSIDA